MRKTEAFAIIVIMMVGAAMLVTGSVHLSYMIREQGGVKNMTIEAGKELKDIWKQIQEE